MNNEKEVYTLEYCHLGDKNHILAVSLDESKLQAILDNIKQYNDRLMELANKMSNAKGEEFIALRDELLNLKLNHPLTKYGYNFNKFSRERHTANFVFLINRFLKIGSYPLI